MAVINQGQKGNTPTNLGTSASFARPQILGITGPMVNG
jgi:hypothetical protein